MELKGARVLVTGGSRGIGAALASAYADAGALVIVASRSKEDLCQVAGRIGGAIHVADLFDSEVVDGLIGDVEAAHGPIDILVNNAGIETVDPVATVDPDALRVVARVNLEAPMVLTRRVLPGMLERRFGAVVFISSLAGTAGFPGMGPYCATKAGLNNFAASLRLELKGSPISTTLVTPGPVDTRMWDSVESACQSVQRTNNRFQKLGLIPKTTPELLAHRVVAATASGRRHVRHPRRLTPNFWMSESPRRLTELLLTGVRIDPLDRTI
ncbi:MAG: SDR family oxidoreductase [Acidimicrobiales bacterium]|jgi:short-subunit dehydrogenase|nr:short-chain dehydrogenase [Acidimicrobiaceae bacterium]MDP6076809.1 SDR family oxidoreductase [Acidimicrobiales bacterium]MDP7259151.1 SDR family oxidoreductase [Acidimicrobiales bacterium]HCV36976.1 short-chain dehydrogenase [Acidimicrobiaceae bacterium]HJO80412.1 SDR family oxidoreductase [Acidimicrobiales bacterium]|tara:strand:+ start:3930 stop:4739 length:810 start_codon:yes stop_codon:yes gene_type:complete